MAKSWHLTPSSVAWYLSKCDPKEVLAKLSFRTYIREQLGHPIPKIVRISNYVPEHIQNALNMPHMSTFKYHDESSTFDDPCLRSNQEDRLTVIVKSNDQEGNVMAMNDEHQKTNFGKG